MEIGTVGLPKAGKSTLFNALTAAGAARCNSSLPGAEFRERGF